MKVTVVAVSIVINLIALSLFGFLIYQKGGLAYVNEKITQTRDLAWRKWFAAPHTSEIAQAISTIKLPSPETDKGRPLMQVLKERQSGRSFADKVLTLQELSNLLWAADGITRKDGRRTAPSARNVQEFDIYIILKDGVYVYDPKNNQLMFVAEGDFRKDAGLDSYVATAPVNLIYVADLSKINWTTDERTKTMVASLDVGFIAENVALFCTSEGLVSVPRINIDIDLLAVILKLRPEQRIILGTTVGHPK